METRKPSCEWLHAVTSFTALRDPFPLRIVVVVQVVHTFFKRWHSNTCSSIDTDRSLLAILWRCAASQFESLFLHLPAEGVSVVSCELVTSSSRAQMMLCCPNITKQEHCSSWNNCAVLWHCSRKPSNCSQSRACSNTRYVWKCMSKEVPFGIRMMCRDTNTETLFQKDPVPYSMHVFSLQLPVL